MKKLYLIGTALVLALAAAGCGSTGAATAGKAAVEIGFPDWMADLPPADAIWGVGSARIVGGADPSIAMTTAQNRALVAIARELDSNIQAMFTDYSQVAGDADNPRVLQLQENISRNVTNMKVSGAQRSAGPTQVNGVLWMRYSLSKADAKKQVSDIINNEAAQYTEFKASQALQLLDAQLDKQQAKPVPVTQ
jgi:hypothetical protein